MADADLRLYVGAVEYGTIGNPISFGTVTAGQVSEHSLNPFYLWNDKGGGLGSLPAKEIEIQVLDMWFQDENMGTSNGSPSQAFTCDVIPVVDDTANIAVKVGTEVWARVSNFIGQANTAKVYTFNATTGVVTFGDGVNGKIPTNGLIIYITYMPDKLMYGKEIYDNTWLEIKSSGTTSNVISVVDELLQSDNTTLVTLANPKILSVDGVWLLSDPLHAGTNYYTGGSFDAYTGLVTLGTPLAEERMAVFVNYTYTIVDENESAYVPIGRDTTHTFLHQIPRNNAKLIYLRLNVPVDATPSGGGNVCFRFRLKYRQ